MLARIRKSEEEKDQGFTLIELLVVMIIIGILAAIAIPVFLSQRKKAQDAAAKADVSTIGKEIATYYVDGTGSTPRRAAGDHGSPAVATSSTSPPSTACAPRSPTRTWARPARTTCWPPQFYTDGTALVRLRHEPPGRQGVTGVKYSAAGGLVRRRGLHQRHWLIHANHMTRRGRLEGPAPPRTMATQTLQSQV